MKQLLFLLCFLLVLMLVITTVMAVGNVKQSEMLAQRTEQISTLKKNLRKANQAQDQLRSQLDREQAAASALRTERSAMNRRFGDLMQLLGNRWAGTTAIAAAPSGLRPPYRPLPGEEKLKTQAVQNALTLLAAEQTTLTDSATPAPITQALVPPTAAAALTVSGSTIVAETPGSTNANAEATADGEPTKPPANPPAASQPAYRNRLLILQIALAEKQQQLLSLLGWLRQTAEHLMTQLTLPFGGRVGA